MCSPCTPDGRILSSPSSAWTSGRFVLHADVRPSLPASAGKAKRVDYEYARRGTSNIFCVTAPKLGIHLTHATPDRKTVAFAAALELVIAEFAPTPS